MKKGIFILIILGLVLPLAAQEQTLLSGPLVHGGYGGPSIKVGSVYDSNALFVGGMGGWIINHSFVLGGGGYGLVSEIRAPQAVQPAEGSDASELYIDMGYGGVMIQYIADSDKLIHYTLSALIGAGGVAYSDRRSTDYETTTIQENDAFFVAEPGINVELNVTTNFRLNAGVNYLYIAGVNNITGLTSKDLDGPSFQLTLKFGKF